MDAPLISVIVPVYKVEKYLDRCVQSIVDQTYRNLEIILVDDGSPDNCGAMCDAWAEKDSRIRVIHKENGGSAQARNAGLDYATGEYISFVDSDDYIHTDMLFFLMQTIRIAESDIAECNYRVVDDNTDYLEVPGNDTLVCYSTEQALRENIRDCTCRQLVWNKLYACRTLDGVRFVEKKFIDDEFFTYRAIAQSKKIAVTSKPYYFYRQQSGSAMHQRFSLKWLQSAEAKIGRLEYISAHYPALLPDARKNLFQTCLYLGQMSLLHLEPADQAAAFGQLKAALATHPLTADDLRSLPLKRRVWPVLARWNFKFCCKLRNTMKKGL